MSFDNLHRNCRNQNRRFSLRFCPLSRQPKQSRLLTEGERQLATSVFGDSLKLDDIQIKTAWWVLKNYAVSPNGNIYFNPKDYLSDFSAASLGHQSWLIHELTHVWQLQHGLKVVRGALLNRRYQYELVKGKPFLSYGIEQQARMVQDYFIRKQRGQDCQELSAYIPFLKDSGLKNSDLKEKTMDA